MLLDPVTNAKGCNQTERRFRAVRHKCTEMSPLYDSIITYFDGFCSLTKSISGCNPYAIMSVPILIGRVLPAIKFLRFPLDAPGKSSNRLGSTSVLMRIRARCRDNERHEMLKLDFNGFLESQAGLQRGVMGTRTRFAASYADPSNQC